MNWLSPTCGGKREEMLDVRSFYEEQKTLYQTFLVIWKHSTT